MGAMFSCAGSQALADSAATSAFGAAPPPTAPVAFMAPQESVRSETTLFVNQ